MEERLSAMEEQVRLLLEQGQTMKGELHELRDRVKEEEHSKLLLQPKVREMEEEATSLREEIRTGKEEARGKIKKVEDRLLQQQQQQQQQRNGGE